MFDNFGICNLLSTYSYVDDVYFAAFQDPLDLAPAYDRIDLGATWMSSSEEWSVSAFANKLQDEMGIRQIQRGLEGEASDVVARLLNPVSLVLSWHTSCANSVS